MEFIGDETYDAILRLRIAQAKLINEDYNLILSIVNDLLGLEGDVKYSKLTDCKYVKEKFFEKKKFKKTLMSYSTKIKNVFGIELNEKNKASTELKKVLKKIKYTLKYSSKYECYSIVSM